MSSGTQVIGFYDPGYAGPQAERRTVEVYVPDGPGPHPWMVYIHGGGFKSVSPNRGETFAAALQQAGIAVALVGYRLTDPSRPGLEAADAVSHPDHVRDIAKAVRFLVDNASSQRLRLDPDRRGIMGHSAGALLAGMVLTNPTFLGEVGLSTADWRAGVLIDSEAYRFDDVLPRERTTLPVLTERIFGVSRGHQAPRNDARPIGFNQGPLYDAIQTSNGLRPAPLIYPTLSSGPGEQAISNSPHPFNASSYYNITAGHPVAPLLMVYGTAPGRKQAAEQMRDAALEAGQYRARTFETSLNHGQINWYFGRRDLGPEAKRYTQTVIAWLLRRFEMS